MPVRRTPGVLLAVALALGPAAIAAAAPPAPGLAHEKAPALRVKARPPASVELSWEDPDFAVSPLRFEVRRDGKVVFTVVGTPRAVVDGVKPGRRTCFSVRTIDGAGRRHPTTVERCLTLPDVTPPTVPGAPAAVPGPAEIGLSWRASTDDGALTGYEVLVDGLVGGRVGAAAARISDLEPGRQYCFEVVAVDGAGHRSRASDRACAVPLPNPPPGPPALEAVATSTSSVHFRWAPGAGDAAVVAYEIAQGEVVAQTEGMEWRVGGLATGVEACAEVVAIDGKGRRSAPSPGPARSPRPSPHRPPSRWSRPATARST